MATLNIRPLDPVEARQQPVTIYLCDTRARPVVGYTSTGEIVAHYQGSTDASGVLDVDLAPNADIEPANTGYMVEIGNTGHLIVKSSATQTVYEALATNLGPLDPIVGAQGPAGPAGAQGAGVPLGGTTGQVLAKASAADNDTAWATPDVTQAELDAKVSKAGDSMTGQLQVPIRGSGNYGSQLLTNGSFATGDFTGWTAGAGWSVSSGRAYHTPGSTATLTQTVNSAQLVNNGIAQLYFTVAGATAGYVDLTFNGNSRRIVAAKGGAYLDSFFMGFGTTGVPQTLTITPSSDFDGYVDGFSLYPYPGPRTPQQGVAFGSSDYYLSMGDGSLAFGYQVLQWSDGAYGNVGIGSGCMTRTIYCEGNVAIGNDALALAGDARDNVAVGKSSGAAVSIGRYNVFVGGYAGWASGGTNTTEAWYQTFVGYGSGMGAGAAAQFDRVTGIGAETRVTATGGVAIGSQASVAAGHDNSVALGTGTTTAASNQVNVGARDIEITDATRGVIMRSPNGTRWRFTIDDAGTISAVSL